MDMKHVSIAGTCTGFFSFTQSLDFKKFWNGPDLGTWKNNSRERGREGKGKRKKERKGETESAKEYVGKRMLGVEKRGRKLALIKIPRQSFNVGTI